MKRAIRRRVHLIDTRTNDRNGSAACIESGSVSSGVDAECKTRDHGDVRCNERTGDSACNSQAALRRVARADDGDCTLVTSQFAAGEEKRGCLMNSSEPLGVFVVQHGNELVAFIGPASEFSARDYERVFHARLADQRRQGRAVPDLDSAPRFKYVRRDRWPPRTIGAFVEQGHERRSLVQCGAHHALTLRVVASVRHMSTPLRSKVSESISRRSDTRREVVWRREQVHPRVAHGCPAAAVSHGVLSRTVLFQRRRGRRGVPQLQAADLLLRRPFD